MARKERNESRRRAKRSPRAIIAATDREELTMQTDVYVYVPPSETESRFVEWLRVKAAGVKEEFGRWLETPEGECSDDEWCTDCVKIQRYIERHKRTRFTSISGWNDHPESDSPRRCARCGVLLCHSLTRYGIESEIEGLRMEGPLYPGDAAIVLNFLDGIGDYRRAKDWPVIEPHAIRFMQTDATAETSVRETEG